MSEVSNHPTGIKDVNHRVPNELRHAIETRLAEMADDFGTTTEEITLVALCMFLFGAPTDALSNSMIQNDDPKP